MATPISIFISYARIDSAFVDRLEADLQARSFYTWVDRRKLEGGQNWVDELQQAVDCCHILLIVLSPDAVESKYVRMEYRYAQTLNKPIIPLEYRLCSKVPIDLNGLQWVKFQTSYDEGLIHLLATLSHITPVTIKPPTQPLKAAFPAITKESDLVVPQPAPSPPASNLNTLYREGIIARTEGDLERAAAFWQQILDHDPNFGNKTLVTLMEQLQKEIHPYRIKRLHERALQAHQAGEWGQELGAWQALLGLEPNNVEAKRANAIAVENQQHVWMYENALEFMREGQFAAAKFQLEMLWQFAPNYGDPREIAEKVGLNISGRLKKSYSGTLKKLREGSISWQGILQLYEVDLKGTSIRGKLTIEPSRSTSFEGDINNGDVVFISEEVSGLAQLKFSGKQLKNGHLAGSYENPRISADKGIWEVS